MFVICLKINFLWSLFILKNFQQKKYKISPHFTHFIGISSDFLHVDFFLYEFVFLSFIDIIFMINFNLCLAYLMNKYFT